jgi:glycerol-3-phosphate dehydrogenase (NAD(P)+)
VLKEELDSDKIVAMSGPNHCEEVGKRMPTATVIACKNNELLNKIKPVFNRGYFKVYMHDDIVGVELCGALKNITAIAAGVVDGLGLGDNTKASIITLGLTEMNTFCRHFGAKRATIYGLAGVGDLIATCTSKLSRNRFVGQKIAEGKHFDEIKEEMHGMVAEGVTTSKAVYNFSIKHDLEMHLTSQVYKVLYEEKDLKKAIKDLINLI